MSDPVQLMYYMDVVLKHLLSRIPESVFDQKNELVLYQN